MFSSFAQRFWVTWATLAAPQAGAASFFVFCPVGEIHKLGKTGKSHSRPVVQLLTLPSSPQNAGQNWKTCATSNDELQRKNL
jgi:hypothetical protein